MGDVGHDSAEDDDGDPVPDTLFSNQFAQPQGEHGPGSQSGQGGYRGEKGTSGESPLSEDRRRGLGQEEDLSIPLQDGEGDRHEMGVAIELIPACLTLSLQLL